MTTSATNVETVAVRAPRAPKQPGALRVESKSIQEGGDIDKEFVFTGCGGRNRSPQLSWSGAPAGTRSFAITCFDPDAPTGCGYWHWLLFDLGASTTSLEAGAGTEKSPPGTKTGYNDFGASSYCGPCPPKGDVPHRYIFTVYALDIDRIEGANESTTGATLVFQMAGHVLASGSISGRFSH
jgi:Raf kinase inhibitor-like YbhB/YbcL family protein